MKIVLTATVLLFSSFASASFNYGETLAVRQISEGIFQSQTIGQVSVKMIGIDGDLDKARKTVFKSASRDLLRHSRKICASVNGNGNSIQIIENQQDIEEINLDFLECQKNSCSSIALITFTCN